MERASPWRATGHHGPNTDPTSQGLTPKAAKLSKHQRRIGGRAQGQACAQRQARWTQESRRVVGWLVIATKTHNLGT